VTQPCKGGVLLRGSADELDWYARELMRLPFPFEVRSPPELRVMVAALARRLAQDHGEPAADAGKGRARGPAARR
jgi:hypothetical protein